LFKKINAIRTKLSSTALRLQHERQCFEEAVPISSDADVLEFEVLAHEMSIPRISRRVPAGANIKVRQLFRVIFCHFVLICSCGLQVIAVY
jgi:hypothetical protein